MATDTAQTKVSGASGKARPRLAAHERVKQQVRELLAQRWAPGTRLPPIAALARQLGAGHNNTHRAVRELVAEGLLISRPGMGTAVPDVAAPTRSIIAADEPAAPRSAGAVRGKVVQIVYCEGHAFLLQMVESAREHLRLQRCRVKMTQFGTSDRHRTHELIDPSADAVMLINPFSPVRVGPHQVLSVVTTSVNLGVAMPGGYDIVSVDSDQGGYLAGEHLRKIGCESVCFVGCRNDVEFGYDMTSAVRLAGFERGWGEPLPRERCCVVHRYISANGAQAVAKYLAMAPRPQGVFCASDDLAFGFVHGALAHGLHAGRDYRLIGFDGQDRGRDIDGGPLTTIEVPTTRMGAVAAQLLTDRFNQPGQPVRRLALGCSLRAGNT